MILINPFRSGYTYQARFLEMFYCLFIYFTRHYQFCKYQVADFIACPTGNNWSKSYLVNMIMIFLNDRIFHQLLWYLGNYQSWLLKIVWYLACYYHGQRPYAMLKAPVPSITVVKQHWAQSVLGWVTAYKRVNHTKDWLALLLARCWSHREEGIKKHTPSAWRVALWDPSVGSGPNSAGSVWPAGNNGHASLRDAWKQTNKQHVTTSIVLLELGDLVFSEISSRLDQKLVHYKTYLDSNYYQLLDWAVVFNYISYPLKPVNLIPPGLQMWKIYTS
jgi:hypothetical protein